MSVLGVIPARGGSKGVPRKNIHLLGGRPLIAHTIEAARRSASIDRLIVSTDCEEIAAVVGDPALTPFLRPAELAADDTPDLPVFVHALDWLREHERYEPEVVVHLRPTSPLRRGESIARAVDLLRANPDADSVRSVTIPTQSPFKMWRVEGRWLEPLLACKLPEPYNQPRQRLPVVYWQNAAVDVVHARVIRGGSMTGRRILPFLMEARESVDIDTLEDFLLAEALLAR